jgi:oligopeptide/dipeptide ABC transporter ATP-binding protein
LEQDEILQLEDLHAYFYTQEGIVRAVDGVSLTVRQGKVLGVVGESGCGKSVTAQSVLQIIPPPGRIISGHIRYRRRLDGDSMGEASEVIDITSLPPRGKEMREIRGGEISMVFQEPMTSLDPVYTIGDHLLEAITLHQSVDKREARQRATEMLESVGMPQPVRTVDAYPHQLSGGMRQRAMIAIALSCYPSLLIADEPTTALDVTTEAQILDLMRGLQQRMGSAIMYITHDLGVIAEMSDDVIVMYLGKVVERADVDTLFYDPRHPYTRALLDSIPKITSKRRQRLQPIRGIVPDPYAVPEGCPFWPRCVDFMPGTCDRELPTYLTVEPGHSVRCHLYS